MSSHENTASAVALEISAWREYCQVRHHQDGKPFWATCQVRGPEHAEKALRLKPGGAEGVFRKFWQWYDERPPVVPVPPVPVVGPMVVPPAPVVVGDNPLLNAIKAACAAVPNLHPEAEEILTCLLEGLNVYIWGPAGSGKSYLCGQIAGLLSNTLERVIAFRDLQVTGPNFCEVDYLVKIMPTPTGQLQSIPSPLVTGATEGDSLVLIDECDLATAESNVGGLNTPLASRRIYNVLEGQTIEIKDNFFFVAAGNTDLNGPTPEYPSRCAQDGSFRSRFATSTFRIDYSEELEAKILDPRIAKLLSEGRKRIAGKGIQLELSTRVGANLTKSIRKGLRSYERIVQRWMDSMDPTARTQAFPNGVN